MSKGVVFAYSSLVIFVLLLILAPKRLSKQEIYTTVMAVLTVYSDLIFGHLLDMYDFFKDEITFTDLFLQLTLPPTAGVLILNFMPAKTKAFIYYWVVISLLSLLYEWISTKMEYLIPKSWKIVYSIPFYSLGLLYLL